jgi:cation transport ATPase
MKSILQKPTYVFVVLGIAFVVFDVMAYVLAKFPGEINFACTPGAYFTPGNLVYSAVFSLLFGLFVVGFYELLKHKSGPDASLLSLSGIGILFAGLTTFCTACTIPVISLFGFSVGLSFFTDYNLYFKIAAMLAMIISIYLLNKQLLKECDCG